MKPITIFQAVILSCFLLVSYTTFSNSPDFLVEMKIIDSGTEIGTPSMMIKEGAEGSLSISGENGFVVGLVVNSANEDKVHIIAEIESGQNAISPDLLVGIGQWASISVGALEFHVRVKHHAAIN